MLLVQIVGWKKQRVQKRPMSCDPLSYNTPGRDHTSYTEVEVTRCGAQTDYNPQHSGRDHTSCTGQRSSQQSMVSTTTFHSLTPSPRPDASMRDFHTSTIQLSSNTNALISKRVVTINRTLTIFQVSYCIQLLNRGYSLLHLTIIAALTVYNIAYCRQGTGRNTKN